MVRYLGLLACAAASCAAAAPDLEQVEQAIVRRTNQFRVEQGLARVAPDEALDRAARGFAEYMARTDRYGHSADGTQPVDRARARGYDLCMVSENISYQFTTGAFTTADLARRYMEGWMNSPGHRRNLLEPAVTDTAAAVARSTHTGRYYGVQMFGRPRAKSIEFRITNAARAGVRYRMGRESFVLGPGEARIHTVCAPEDVVFPGAENGEGRTIRPSSGDRLRVEGDRRVTVRAER